MDGQRVKYVLLTPAKKIGEDQQETPAMTGIPIAKGNASSYRKRSNSRDASNRYTNSRAIAGNSDAKGTDVT